DRAGAGGVVRRVAPSRGLRHQRLRDAAGRVPAPWSRDHRAADRRRRGQRAGPPALRIFLRERGVAAPVAAPPQPPPPRPARRPTCPRDLAPRPRRGRRGGHPPPPPPPPPGPWPARPPPEPPPPPSART